MKNEFGEEPKTSFDRVRGPEQLSRQEYIDKGLKTIQDELAILVSSFEAYKTSDPKIDPQQEQEKLKKIFLGIVEKITDAKIALLSPDLDPGKYDPYKDS